MAKVRNVYQDKATKMWLFRAYLGLDKNGKKIQKTKRGYLTQKEAKEAYDKFMLQFGNYQTSSPQLQAAKQMTFEEFYKFRFVRWYEKQVKSQTYENAQFIFEKKLVAFFKMKIMDITSHDIEEWMNELSHTVTKNSRNSTDFKTLSNSYVNRILGHLKIVLDRAVKEGIIDKSPADSVSPFKKRNNKVDFWEVDEFQRVMDTIPENSIQNHQRKITFEMLFYTGMRIGEYQALMWENVDLRRNLITIDKTLVYKTKNDWYLSTPKTDKSYRTIGIGVNLSKKLRKWKQLQQKVGRFQYVSQLDGTFTPSYSFSNWLKQYAREANVRPIKLHALRHSHVAMLIEQNIQPLIIQERLGHANIQITLGTYGHLYAKSDKQVVNLLDKII